MPHSMASVLRLVNDNRDDADEAHKRLRKDLESRLVLVEGVLKDMEAELATVERRSGDVSHLHLSLGMVLSIVVTCLTIAGGMWASTYGLRSDVRDILTRMASNAQLDESRTKLQDDRFNA